jgi:hypothetical protein
MYTVTMTKSLRYAFASMRHRLVSDIIAFGHEVYGTASEPCENATVPLTRGYGSHSLAREQIGRCGKLAAEEQEIVSSHHHHHNDKTAVRKRECTCIIYVTYDCGK